MTGVVSRRVIITKPNVRYYIRIMMIRRQRRRAYPAAFPGGYHAALQPRPT